MLYGDGDLVVDDGRRSVGLEVDGGAAMGGALVAGKCSRRGVGREGGYPTPKQRANGKGGKRGRRRWRKRGEEGGGVGRKRGRKSRRAAGKKRVENPRKSNFLERETLRQ